MAAPTFRPAQRKTLRARVAIEGPSGSGKTWTALSVAVSLAGDGRVALIDTEHGSAELYADEFTFDTLQLDAPYSPQRYLDALKAAAQGGYAVTVIDSLSHAWFAEGGVLDIVDRNKKGQSSYTGWAVGTPQHNLLVDGILAIPMHVVATMRSKQDYVLNERNAPVKVGMAPIQREGMDYEFALVGELDIQHTLTITKSRFNRWEPLKVGAVIRRPDEDWSKVLLEALSSGSEDVGAAGIDAPQAYLAAAETPALTNRSGSKELGEGSDEPEHRSGAGRGSSAVASDAIRSDIPSDTLPAAPEHRSGAEPIATGTGQPAGAGSSNHAVAAPAAPEQQSGVESTSPLSSPPSDAAPDNDGGAAEGVEEPRNDPDDGDSTPKISGKASYAQVMKLQVLATERGLGDRVTRLAAACSVLAGHGFPARAENGLVSFNDLSKQEAHALIEAWEPAYGGGSAKPHVYSGSDGGPCRSCGWAEEHPVHSGQAVLA